MVDLLEKTDVVWRDGYPTQLTLAEMPTAIERLQIAEIRSSRPCFSWIVPSLGKNTRQTAWQLQLASSMACFSQDAKEAPEMLWDSGKVVDQESTARAYSAQKPLDGGSIYYWRVRFWNQEDQPSDWSAIKAFKTAKDCQDYGISRYPLTKLTNQPVASHDIDGGQFFDFGRASFGQLFVDIDAKHGDVALVRMGERVKDGAVDRRPAGTTRFWEYRLELLPGRHVYAIKTRVDKRNSSGAAFLLPDYIGEVMPFRYAEIEIISSPSETADSILPAKETTILGVTRETVVYPFDETAALFHCDNDDLNRVWDLCKYSIAATTFAGVYLDGDRERIPYEGDALLNQLSHYCVDREYSLARYSLDYLVFHPTWPTEWNLQTVQMAWFDYLYTGDSRAIAQLYDDLRAKSLVALAEENGLISTRKGKLTKEVLDSIHFKGNGFRDIVDWPHKGLAGNDNAESGETDGFVFCDFNVVVNSYHFFALNSMRRFAQILGKTEDEKFFADQIAKLQQSFHETFFDASRGVYRDGETTDHASLHGNMFPLAFGLTPSENVASVTEFVESRGMRCSVYGAQFLLDAAYQGENGAYGLERMTAQDLRGWLNMLRVGSTISLEAWDDCYKPNQDWNHAWGAAPANIIPRKLVGVEPLAPGCAEIQIKPQIANLTEVVSVVPTIRGSVEIKVSQELDKKNVYRLQVRIPGNVVATVYLPYTDDSDTLLIDGRPAKEVVDGIEHVGAFWKIPKIGSDVWTFERIAP
ncbi:MAG: alpha-L-rhamnosidase C-terminal domain-containing protein [Planctomycetia bacterium]|nr:alpha-L-rhamnosidase C-terminal domain-containing protein [Planctomycetia bacterium]